MSDAAEPKVLERMAAALRYGPTQFGPIDKWIVVEKIPEGFRTISIHDGRPAAAKEAARLNALAILSCLEQPTEAMINYADKHVRPDSDNMQCPDWFKAAIRSIKDGSA